MDQDPLNLLTNTAELLGDWGAGPGAGRKEDGKGLGAETSRRLGQGGQRQEKRGHLGIWVSRQPGLTVVSEDSEFS